MAEPTERPRWENATQDEEYQEFRVNMVAKNFDTSEIKQIVEFTKEVEVMLHTVGDNAYQATMMYMEAPKECNINKVVEGYPKLAMILGMFAGKKAVLIKTNPGAACLQEIKEAFQEFPNICFIILVGMCYAFDHKVCKLGDVLVSTKISTLQNFEIEIETKTEDVNYFLSETFCNQDFEQLFKVSTNNRNSVVYSGKFLSFALQMDDERMRNAIHAGIPDAVGGEMEGGVIMEALQDYISPVKSVIAIKGVVDYGDGTERLSWQYTAAKAAIHYVQSKLRAVTLPIEGSFAGLQKLSLSNEVSVPKKWSKKKTLGKGAFGEVFLVCDDDNGRPLAMKAVEVPSQTSSVNKEKAFDNEVKFAELLKNLQHERIITYYGTEISNGTLKIFMEYMPGGSLSQLVQKTGPINEKRTKKYTTQVIEGVQYLHENGIIHRDIKGGNILLDSNDNVKLADFGVSKRLQNIQGDPSSVQGTAWYMAPEVILGKQYREEADIWSIGATVYEMLTGKHPWHDLTEWTLRGQRTFVEKDMVPDIPAHCSKEAHSFITMCFTIDQKKRPSAKELLYASFLSTRGYRLSDEKIHEIISILEMFASRWIAIGICLGFTASELDAIKAKPVLFLGAPRSWLNKMLWRWFEWCPGDSRGSRDYASLESLAAAVDKAGLGRVAEELRNVK